jgi:glycosyltransferase involved in cell wall biosynthesis
MLFYKIPIFNKLSIYLKNKGYKLIIWYTNINDPNEECDFNFIHNTPMTIQSFQKVIDENKIEVIINFLHKSDPGYYFYFASILKAKLLKLPVIFYGHGIDKQKDQWWRNFLYNLTHFLFDGIILYSPNGKQKLWKFFHHKITCANNTLDLADTHVTKTKEVLKSQYNIQESKVILTTGRLNKRKHIEILSEIFIHNYKNSQTVAWVLIGPDLNDHVKNEIKDVKNIYYLGPIYEKKKMADFFFLADIYCVPGALGLGINEALYWGLPIVTMNVNHGPEAYYLRKGCNSLIAKDKKELNSMIDELLNNDEKRFLYSANGKKVFQEEATLDKMFEGFSLQLERFYN